MSGAFRACPSQESEAPSGDQWELATFSLDCRKLRISPGFHLCSIGCLGPFSNDRGFLVYPVYGIRAPSTQTGLWVTSVLNMALWPSIPLSPLPLSDKNSLGPDLLLCWTATVLVMCPSHLPGFWGHAYPIPRAVLSRKDRSYHRTVWWGLAK